MSHPTQTRRTRGCNMALFVFLNGALVTLRPEVVPGEGDQVDVLLHPEPAPPPREGVLDFERVMAELDASSMMSAGMKANKQLRALMIQVWNARGRADALAVASTFETTRRPTFTAITQSILRRSR